MTVRKRTVLTILAAALVLAPLAARAADPVGAIGRLAPKGGIVELGGTAGAQIESILVKPHEVVHRGDVLVILNTHDVLKAETEIARLELDAAEKQAKDRVALQRAVLAAARLRQSHEEAAVAEYQGLGANAVAKAELTRRQNAAAEAKNAVEIEAIRLRQLEKEVEHERAKAALELALSEARLKSSVVTAPRDGTVLEILKRAGESLRGDAIVRMADLSELYVICDVFEGDLLKLKPGMRATASSKALPGPLEGVVDRIGRVVDTERKLASVVVRLTASEAAERLIGMEVQVIIQTGGGE